MDRLPLGWFDLIAVALLVTGAVRGRKHGLSEELIPMLRWLAVVAVAAVLYRPIGQFIEQHTLLSKLSSYLSAYLGCVLFVLIAVSIIKKLAGGKPISAERFGKCEYYLGICAGVVTVGCIMIVALSFLNARKFTSAEIQARKAYDLDVYGSSFFPSLDSVQSFVFKKSLVGDTVQRYASSALIEPTKPESKKIQRKEWNMP
jgi:uncharacterized membrane protein required for colicin V production